MSYKNRSNFFITDSDVNGLSYSISLRESVVSYKSDVQKIDIVDTDLFGRILITDGLVMSAEKDEFIYHELLVHVPMNVKENVRNVLVIGGGDGGTVRELSKYDSIQRIDMVEIDKDIIEITQKNTNLWKGVDFSRLNLVIGDGFSYVKETKEKYDLVITDISGPVDISISFYSEDFFRNLYSILTEDGVGVIQGESYYIAPFLVKYLLSVSKKIFKVSEIYSGYIPSFIFPWSFVIVSKKNVPSRTFLDKTPSERVRYYSKEIHFGSFALPRFIKEFFEKEDVENIRELPKEYIYKSIFDIM